MRGYHLEFIPSLPPGRRRARRIRAKQTSRVKQRIAIGFALASMSAATRAALNGAQSGAKATLGAGGRIKPRGLGFDRLAKANLLQ
jgi:hypothetical protein